MKLQSVFNILLISSAAILAGMNTSKYQTGPHNGVVEKAGNYYIEMKSIQQEIHAYLLDKRMVAISNKGISCEAKLIFTDSSTLIKRLKPFGNDGFSAGIPSIQYYYCRISFNIAGKEVSAGFENQNLIVEKK